MSQIGGDVRGVGAQYLRAIAYYSGNLDQLELETAIALMHATRTLHPPGGATALIAVIGSPDVHALGFLYVLVPCTLAPLVLLAVALVVNNLPRFRRYPEYWY